MKISILTFFVFFTIGLWAQSVKQNATLSDDDKIEFLINKVEHLENAKFVRNGTYHDAKAAASHLRLKWEKAGSAIKTVDDFIEKIATKSSISGEPYTIEYSNGKKITAKEFYRLCLKELEKPAQP